MYTTPLSNFRFTNQDKSRWQAAAKLEGLTLTAFLARAADREAARVERKHGSSPPSAPTG